MKLWPSVIRVKVDVIKLHPLIFFACSGKECNAELNTELKIGETVDITFAHGALLFFNKEFFFVD